MIVCGLCVEPGCFGFCGHSWAEEGLLPTRRGDGLVFAKEGIQIEPLSHLIMNLYNLVWLITQNCKHQTGKLSPLSSKADQVILFEFFCIICTVSSSSSHESPALDQQTTPQICFPVLLEGQTVGRRTGSGQGEDPAAGRRSQAQ